MTRAVKFALLLALGGRGSHGAAGICRWATEVRRGVGRVFHTIGVFIIIEVRIREKIVVVTGPEFDLRSPICK